MGGRILKLLTRKEENGFISMIDVVFLLLIFFMLATRFKQVENKLDAFLPKDIGQENEKLDVKPEEITIFVKDDRVARTSDNLAVKSMRRATFYSGSRQATPVTNPNELYGRLLQLAANPEQRVLISMYNDQIYKDQLVPFYNIVAVLDVCKRAGIEKIQFQAPPNANLPI